MTPDARDNRDTRLRRGPAEALWQEWLASVQARMQLDGVAPSRTVVLLPYAQMMQQARLAWVGLHPDGLAPRWETTRNWAASLSPFFPSATDLSADMARDTLVAGAWLEQVAGTRLDRQLRPVLIARLMEMARQIAPLAAARPPAERQAWAQEARAHLVQPAQSLQWEVLLASLALTWAGHSGYATDVFWTSEAAPGAVADLLVIVNGFQRDPLTEALSRHWQDRVMVLELPFCSQEPDAQSPNVGLHLCDNAQDEAERAFACVLGHLQAGRRPVALVATDRLLTRRVGALLSIQGVRQADETGWRLSTTHAAARFMALLRAASPRAHMDEVLDLLKLGGVWPAEMVDRLEAGARRLGISSWGQLQRHHELSALIPVEMVAALSALQGPRPLSAWLDDVRLTLERFGWLGWFQSDAAGQQLLRAIHLSEVDAVGIRDLLDNADAAKARSAWTLPVFTGWCRQVLESANFATATASEPDVVILPMAQLLGRSFAAVVAPGCDEVHLPSSPELPGWWSTPQRELLGLPSRESVALAALNAWRYLLRSAPLDVLWRQHDQTESVLPAPWVRALLAQQQTGDGGGGEGHIGVAEDPRHERLLAAAPIASPRSAVPDLLPGAMSASAYQDLRDCPYRFMVLRQWRLRESDELDDSPDKRDMGLWLHAVLGRFHEERRDALSPEEDDRSRLDRMAREEAQQRGLWTLDGDGAPGFLPFLAAWPILRDGYLQWLDDFEKSAPKPVFERAEASLRRTVGGYVLVGQVDRIDRLDGQVPPSRLVIDYKTEPREVTRSRVAQPLEDTQLAFYAALLGDSDVRLEGGYLSITDSLSSKDGATRLVPHPALDEARDALLQGLAHDLERIESGHEMLALGEGRVCEFCAARGLCRKDFWGASS